MATSTLSIPEDATAEQAVLAAVILDNSLLAEAAVLQPSAFASPKHQQIFTAMLALAKADQPIDIVTLLGAMKGQEIELAGSELTALIDGTPLLDNITGYVEQVHRKHVIRKALRACVVAVRGLQEEDANLATVQEIAVKLAAIGDSGLKLDDAVSMSEYGHTWSMELEEKRNAPLKAKIPTGFQRLDRNLGGGLGRGHLVSIGGRPGSGKSALMFTFAMNMSRAGYKVLVQEMEMSKSELLDRGIAALTRIDSRSLASGRLTDEETKQAYNAAMEMATWPLTINDARHRTPEDLYGEIRRQARSGGIDVVVVDYLGLLKYRTRDLRVEMGIALKEYRDLARELDIAIVMGAQLNRSADSLKEGERPTLAAFKESGNIEEDSDTVLFPQRNSFRPGEKQSAVEVDCEIVIAKNRNGPVGSIPVEFHPPYVLYRERI